MRLNKNYLVLILALVAVFGGPISVLLAQGAPDIDTSLPLGNGRYLSARSANGQNENRLLSSDSSDNTLINAPSGSTVKASIAKTPVVAFDATDGITFTAATQGFKAPAAAVITISTTYPTPSAGNTLSNKHTIVAAGAPTAAYVALPAITANVGEDFYVYNQGSNPVAIAPNTGVINASAALTPFSCSTLKVCKCHGLITTTWGCSEQ